MLLKISAAQASYWCSRANAVMPSSPTTKLSNSSRRTGSLGDAVCMLISSGVVGVRPWNGSGVLTSICDSRNSESEPGGDEERDRACSLKERREDLAGLYF